MIVMVVLSTANMLLVGICYLVGNSTGPPHKSHGSKEA